MYSALEHRHFHPIQHSEYKSVYVINTSTSLHSRYGAQSFPKASIKVNQKSPLFKYLYKYGTVKHHYVCIVKLKYAKIQ